MNELSSHKDQSFTVDTTGRLCRVDTGLKTVAGVKRYVTGTKLCLRPDIKPSIHPTRNKPAHGDRSRNQSPLFPGLPDDLAIACLIRVPRVEHRKLRLVCKRWYHLLTSNFFYSLRKSHEVAEEWIYVIKRDRDGKISWHAFDPVYQLWQPLPPIPKEYFAALGFGCAVLSGCHLYLFGGKDPLKGSMRRVIFYIARKNKWHRAPDMLRRMRMSIGPKKAVDIYPKKAVDIPSRPVKISIQRKQLKDIIDSLLPACTTPDLEIGVPFRAQAIIANPPTYVGDNNAVEIEGGNFTWDSKPPVEMNWVDWFKGMVTSRRSSELVKKINTFF
ncbi:F-box/kelch-repeat protein [Arachis hypogaea]|nr:F-box/kelch-repeat protein [Arachis hypogaea]